MCMIHGLLMDVCMFTQNPEIPAKLQSVVKAKSNQNGKFLSKKACTSR
jgi:hypothetical protein